ncbi:hypothetical protein SH1V18_32450 [Vallitalea longa]|uniref:TNT domain-containing protein n=1 Tax=Vallitalea longa TaxID=2936439 RepID=A0A9W6DFN2_9FIRM|nr:TNT domain-containing protein [Vallitalea longa]GKX30765.1 hypothetical protein SH1V18_32450 [Vallitalea longa]
MNNDDLVTISFDELTNVQKSKFDGLADSYKSKDIVRDRVNGEDGLGVVDGVISNLWKESTCSSDELYNYLLKNVDADAARKFVNDGIWPDSIQIPKNSSVLNPDGSIDWSKAAQGGYILDAESKVIKESFSPEIGEVIDRYGNSHGRYTSPVIDGNSYSYTERSLPYVEDLSNYHQYEVTGNFNEIEKYVSNCPDVELKTQIDALVTTYYNDDYSKLLVYKGEAAKIDGWGAGRAIQYELPLTVDQLIQIGLLKELN